MISGLDNTTIIEISAGDVKFRENLASSFQAQRPAVGELRGIVLAFPWIIKRCAID